LVVNFASPGLQSRSKRLIRASGGRFETRWGGLGGSPVAHRTIKGSIKSIESGRQLVDSWRGSRRPLRQNFFCAGHRVGCAGPPPREKLVSKTLGRPGCLRLARSGKSPRLVAKELRSFFSRNSYTPPKKKGEFCSPPKENIHTLMENAECQNTRGQVCAVPLSQADFGCFEFAFVFRLGGPTPSEAAGGRPLTERSKTLGLGEVN